MCLFHAYRGILNFSHGKSFAHVVTRIGFDIVGLFFSFLFFYIQETILFRIQFVYRRIHFTEGHSIQR